MSNETFQIIITGAVILAFLSMVVQGFAALALYRVSRKMAADLSPVFARLQAILTVEKESIRQLEIVIDKTLVFVDIMERFGPRIEALSVRGEAVAQRTMRLGGQVSGMKGSWELVATASHLTALEMRPRLASLASETTGLVRSTGIQLRRVGRVMHEAIMHFAHICEIAAFRS